MTRSDFLKQLGLTDLQLSNLVLKFRVFYASLTEQEAGLVNRLLPNFKRVAGVFGGDITKDELKSLLAPPPPAPPPPPSPGAPAVPAPPTAGVAGAFGQNGINQITNGDGNGG